MSVVSLAGLVVLVATLGVAAALGTWYALRRRGMHR